MILSSPLSPALSDPASAVVDEQAERPEETGGFEVFSASESRWILDLGVQVSFLGY
jgi:hypothetical protein